MKKFGQRLLVGLTFASLTVALGNASTIAFYANIFNPGQTASTGPVAPLTNPQLIAAAATATKYDTTASGFSTTVALPKFDQTGPDAFHIYVLDSVQLAVGWASLGAIDVTNTTGSSQSFTSATSTVPLTFSAPVLASFLVNATAGPVSGTVGPATPVFSDLDLTGVPGPVQVTICNSLGGTLTLNNCHYPSGTVNGTTHVSGVTGSGTASSSLLTTGLAAYQGFGVSNLSFGVAEGLGQYSGSSVTGVSFGGSASAGGTLEVIYNYHTEAIPEPATVTLMGGALIMIGVATRRKLRRS